ncbi:hypothetical protein CLAFUW4_14834 [Fulvia fulva]|nr:hypothetical protein CLAFUR0_14827 [Fulvia fulva]WPV23018.1 hypothetical protein CLAFUW4_14834 [Fulvia fulva]WPV37933.1 hypothetical protein CLAFUW7_14835 [Fulvia fulva]
MALPSYRSLDRAAFAGILVLAILLARSITAPRHVLPAVSALITGLVMLAAYRSPSPLWKDFSIPLFNLSVLLLSRITLILFLHDVLSPTTFVLLLLAWTIFILAGQKPEFPIRPGLLWSIAYGLRRIFVCGLLWIIGLLACQYYTNTAYHDESYSSGAKLAVPLARTVADIHESYISPIDLRIDADWCQLNYIAWSIGCGEELRSWSDRSSYFNISRIPHRRCTTFNTEWNTTLPSSRPTSLSLHSRCNTIHSSLEQIESFGHSFRTNVLSSMHKLEAHMIQYYDTIKLLPDPTFSADKLTLALERRRIITPTFSPTSYTHSIILALPLFSTLHPWVSRLTTTTSRYDSARDFLSASWTQHFTRYNHSIHDHVAAAQKHGVTLRSLLEGYASEGGPTVYLAPNEVFITSILSKLAMESLTPGLVAVAHDDDDFDQQRNKKATKDTVFHYALRKASRRLGKMLPEMDENRQLWQRQGCQVGGFQMAEDVQVEEEMLGSG